MACMALAVVAALVVAAAAFARNSLDIKIHCAPTKAECQTAGILVSTTSGNLPYKQGSYVDLNLAGANFTRAPYYGVPRHSCNLLESDYAECSLGGQPRSAVNISSNFDRNFCVNRTHRNRHVDVTVGPLYSDPSQQTLTGRARMPHCR